MKVSEIIADARVISAGRPCYKPKISIITPTYCRNAEGLLLNCLDSASIQTFADFEHIVIDDGSSDGSQAVLTDAALRDDRIVYIRHDRNSGLPGVRTNEGIMRARGDAIAFLFDDNVFAADFLEKAWAKLESSDADVIVTNVEMLTKQGDGFLLGGWPQTIELMRNLNTIPNGGVLVRRSFFDRFGLYDPHLLLRRVCDWDLWLRAMRLGAKFAYLDTVSAIEHGLVSPNSLGNTIAWDVKVVYGYMMDERDFAARTQTLTPERIVDVDVLDPTPFFPYLRNTDEWLEVVKTFFEPFTRRASASSLQTLTNRQSVSMPDTWFSKAVGQERRRVLIVGNVVNAWVGTWLEALRNDPALIVLNTPEWNLSVFRPADIDVLVLFEGSYVATVRQIEAFRDAGVPIVYFASNGIVGEDHAERLDANPRDFLNNKDVASTFSGHVYFAQPGSTMNGQHLALAGQIAALSTVVVGTAGAYDLLGASCARVELPRLPAGVWEHREDASESVDRGMTTFDVPSGVFAGAVERLMPPNHRPDTSSSSNQKTMRSTWESLSALVQVRSDCQIAISASSYDDLSDVERFGLSATAARNNLDIISTDGRALKVDHAAAKLVEEWMRNFVRVASMYRGSTEARTAAVFLNSEMFSGSEVYGLALARNLFLLGMEVRVYVPEEHKYGADSGLTEINNWLTRQGLYPVERAPYTIGGEFLRFDKNRRDGEINQLADFIRERSIGVVICSGFMPTFASDNGQRSYKVYQALFQPSAYDLADISYLRGRVDGILSDCAWSLNHFSKIFEGPSRVVRTSLPLNESAVAPVRTHPQSGQGSVRIAVGGTLQPRKRQLEAVLAVSTLRDAGFDVELNIYGYALSMLDDYVRKIDEQIERLNLTGRVRRSGLVPLSEIAANNDIILSASLDESLPQTLLELLRCGLIGAGVLSGGIDEILVDGVTGYLTHDASVDGIVALLRKAIEDRDNWPDMIGRTQAIINRDYSRQSTSNAFVDLLLEGSA
ncbi:glycosyltransferase [Paraburkholderia bryophila]|uniref:Glycosyltransferase involved in cell wall biosynthesis n=1 Tax=Paraburkholderia bryophila TaxID=420952 RepID=A0A7Y9WK14_9BURK|nr:glycosyltransferase [Paraburkholderia bryophila]NYH22317.1 glycosyltransferase involved in cell wall biosynthesis [Paraburkholderia bryophila]